MDKSHVRKALEDSPEPTPGYLYNEFAQWTFKDVSTQTDLVNYLFDRLQRSHTSAFVLYKALHIVKLLCEMAHPDFQREVQRTPRAEVVRQLTTYRGMQDSKFGDAWNEKVRQEARETLANIFTDFSSQQKRQQQQQQSAGARWGANGFGSTTDPVLASSSSAAALGATGSITGGRDAGFYTGLASGVSSSSRAGAGGIDSYAGIESHIGEMPKENKWAEHVARAQSDPDYARRSTRSGASDGASKSFLGQLSSTAKAGWSTLVQHESLRMNANVPAPLGEGRRIQTEDAMRDYESHDNAFVPVIIGGGGGESVVRGHNTSDVPLAASGARWSPSTTTTTTTTVTTTMPSAVAPANRTSGFAFMTGASSQTAERPPAPTSLSPSSPPTTTETAEMSAAAAAHALVHTHMLLPTHTPQRVELSEFVAQAVQLAATFTQTRTHAQAGVAATPSLLVSDALDDVFGTPPTTTKTGTGVVAATATLSNGAVMWTALAAEMCAQLDTTRHAWRTRLNVLACLEALLKASPLSLPAFLDTTATAFSADQTNDAGEVAPLSEMRVAAVLTEGQRVFRRYFTDVDEGGDEDDRSEGQAVAASRLRENASVVQATLKDKAVKVVALLGLSMTPPARRAPQPVPVATTATRAATTAAARVPTAPTRTRAGTAMLDDLFGPSASSTSTTANTNITAAPRDGLFDGVQLARRRPVKTATTTAEASLQVPQSSSPPSSSSAMFDVFGAPVTTTMSSGPAVRQSNSPSPPAPVYCPEALDTAAPSSENPMDEDDTSTSYGLSRPRRSQRSPAPLLSEPWTSPADATAAHLPTEAGTTRGVSLHELFADGPTTTPTPSPSLDVTVAPSAPTTLSSLREAQHSLEALLANLQQRQGRGGADAPTAEELADAQSLLQQQRHTLRQRHEPPAASSSSSPVPPVVPVALMPAPTSTSTDMTSLLFGEPARRTAIWESPEMKANTTAEATTMESAGSAGAPVKTHSHFQMGNASKPSEKQVANTQFAAVQAEMADKYTT